MAFGTREFVLKIVADVKDATRGMDQVADSSTTMRDKVTGIGKSVATGLAVGAVAQFGKASITAASDAQQSVGAMTSVFGDFAGDMERFGSTSAENLGITTQQFNQLSAVTGSLLKNAGLPMDQVTKSTQDLTSRAADLAAMYGTDVTQAVEAMGSAFKGEYDPLESFGISLKASDVTARAMAEGYVDASGEVTDAGKAIAAQEMIMEQSAQAAGTFANESDTLAGQTQILTARFNDTQAELGTKLLPIVMRVLDAFMPLVDLFLRYADVLIPVTAGVAGLVLAFKGFMMVQTIVDLMKKYEVGTKLAAAAQWLWNTAMSMNPIFLIVAAIAAVIAIIVLLYMKVDWFRAFVDTAIDGIVAAWDWLWDVLSGVFNWIKNNWPLLLAILTGPFGVAVYTIVRNWDTISTFFKELPGKIVGWLSNLWNIISSPFKLAADKVSDLWDPIKRFFTDFPSKLNSAWSGLANIIKYPFKVAFDAIKWLWNSTVGGFGFTVPSWIPGVGGKGFRIPEMAAGGIVNRPTIALIGEAGPEAVVPLGSHGFGAVTINVYALTANAEVGRKVYEALTEYQRTSGKAIA